MKTKMEKKWEISGKLGEQAANQSTKVEEIVKLLFKNRGIITKQKEGLFFNPPNQNALSCKDFGISTLELKKAVQRVKKARDCGEKVIVWGDYDVDGISGSALLWEALYQIGVKAIPFIPERRTEGYGLNITRMKQLKEEDQSIGLIITVDNGVVAHQKVDTAKELGVDVIITDHHIPHETKPKAFAILHTTAISGAGVAWVLARELKIKTTAWGIDINTDDDWLGLVALATIADMVPLVGVARALVYHGLKVLCKTDRPAIRALCATSGIDQTKLGVFDVSFVLAPRINAMGRLEHAMDSLRLLCAKNPLKAQEYALRLSSVNSTRQQMVAEAVMHAREQALTLSKDGMIVIAHEVYHEGIIGLVASRLVEEFGRPAAVIAKGEKLSKGSMRSITGFNIVNALKSAQGILIEGGGHPMAAGFTVRTSDIKALSDAFQKHAHEYLTDEVLEPKIKIDCELPLTAVTFELINQLERFAPFGIGNPEPVFVSRKAWVEQARLVGSDNQHLKLRLRSDDNSVVHDAIGFKMGELYPKLSPDTPLDIAYTAVRDSWNGNNKVQLKLKDLHFYS